MNGDIKSIDDPVKSALDSVSIISDSIGIKILEAIYPFVVERIQGKAVVIGTGGDLFKVGDKYRLIQYGEKLNKRLVDVAENKGFKLIASGMPSMPYYRLDGVSFETHIKWIDECVKRGVYMLSYHNHFISLAHSEEDLEFIEAAAKQAFEAL